MSEITNNDLSNKDGRSLIGVILLYIKLELLILLVSLPFILASYILKDYIPYEACRFIEIIGLIFSHLCVIYLHCKKENFKIKVNQKLPIKFYVYILLFRLSYGLLYDSTIGAFLYTFEPSKTITERMTSIASGNIFPIISACLIAPIVEELLFRGVFLEYLRKKSSCITAVLISSLFFGLTHFNLHQGVGAFFSGLFLGFIYLKTNSLLPCIFLHMAHNSFVVLITYFSIYPNEISPIIIIISAGLLVISLLLINRTKIDESKKFNFRFLEKHNLVQ
ncbi:CPBP family intramembrane glutamic endopeptidase [Oceanirhabdus seepicola]|uniref:CPBP family intramembrane metalloprotease n=1 Tax=Oceanirhabdus seepicola TaxID=2828781 RepID=A0A9J6P1I5_9CLOT|nr:CPBP family intramembrane glutamic endopeptidase [Oceanirhabdus seepicola]MCM1989352.1 CPBP family intramembrane metalloprotease [Oceanirhabdus seepicola]